jgi:hypothetical protein
MNHAAKPMIYSPLPGGHKLSINNLPRKFGKPIEVPIDVSSTNGSTLKGDYSLNWEQLDRLPNGWSLTLEDRNSNKKISLRNKSNYAFTININQEKQSEGSNTSTSTDKKINRPTGPPVIAKKQKKRRSRFVLTIDPGNTNGDLPAQFALGDNYPNPFNPETNIPYEVPVESHVRIVVYDILGRRVSTLLNSRQKAGRHTLTHDFSDLASGVYIYRMLTDGNQFTRKMLLIK